MCKEMYNNLPADLKKSGLFCLWKKEEIDGRITKMPYRLNGWRLRSTEHSDFSDFNSAVSYLSNGYNGLGLGIFDGFCAVDIDNCCIDGKISDMAKDIIAQIDSYTEYSPSGKGIRIIFRAQNLDYDKARYYINNRKIGLEIYVSGYTNKYVTLTGNRISGNNAEERSEKLMAVLEKYMVKPVPEKKPTATITETKGENSVGAERLQSCLLSDEEVIIKAAKARNGAKFCFLWNGGIPEKKSHSEADQSLCSILAFWCRGNIAQMDRLFRQSGLYRQKWERSDYRRYCLDGAVSFVQDYYNPKEYAGR